MSESRRDRTTRRVLVVDDSELSRALIARRLRQRGFEVLTANDGAEGAMVALRERPDVVITDLEMPVMDGYQLARLLKSDPATSEIALVILTSHGAASSRFWGLETGADAFLLKDELEDRLLETVEPLAVGRPTPALASESCEAPQGPLEVLARVSRQLDGRLLEAVLVNRILERGMRAETLRDASRAILGTVSDIVDTWVLGLALCESGVLMVRLGLAPEIDRRAAAAAVDRLAAFLCTEPVERQVVIDGGAGEEAGQEPAGEEPVILELALRGARAALYIAPRQAGYRESREHLLLGRVCRQLSLVLDNVRLAERLRELSMRDDLTRLLNRRTIHQRLCEEVHRARRYGHALAVALCDLDHFKAINDTHGHQAGDRVLVAIADVLRQTARAPDVTGRYGGEEFLVLLPETDLANARSAAERLRQSIAEREVVLADGQVLRTTASLGIAALAEVDREGSAESTIPDALLALADERLYAAKAAGRDQVSP